GRGREQIETVGPLSGGFGFEPAQDRPAVTAAATAVRDDDGADQDVGPDLLQPAVAGQSGIVPEAVEAPTGLVEIVRRQPGGLQRGDEVGSGLGQLHGVEGHQQAPFFGAVAGKQRRPSHRATDTSRISTGTSTSGPMTAAKATGEANPNAAMATAI